MLKMMDTETKREYLNVLETLDRGSFWPKEWAAEQELGLLITAMCFSVVNDKHDARRFAVLRVLELLLEDRHDLLPATVQDYAHPRNRIAPFAIPGYDEQCEPWLDVLEYQQLRNWRRKGVHEDPKREEQLRRSIEERFSGEFVAEIEEGVRTWWIN